MFLAHVSTQHRFIYSARSNTHSDIMRVTPKEYSEFLARNLPKVTILTTPGGKKGNMSKGMLARLIMFEFGSDHRTIKKHTSNMVLLGYLAPGLNGWDIEAEQLEQLRRLRNELYFHGDKGVEAC
jgi:hypothetical protein